jgi:ESS family glutamate:Na+ symporter
MIAALALTDFFPAAGVLLPFGFGQGTGQALNYGTIYEVEHGFLGGKSFGLTIAALGFLSASFGGVIHLNIMKRSGKLVLSKRRDGSVQSNEISTEGEIPMQESIDKMTVQIAFVMLAYVAAYLLMVLVSSLLPGLRSVIFGFNFLLGVLTGTLIKMAMNFMYRKDIIHRKYINDFLMTRVSNFFFDLMVVAGVAAIRLDVLENYWGIMLILGFVGLVITYIYNRIVAKTLFPDYAEEQFLTMYGMLTGTASTGIILLREVDEEFRTPAADNMVYQNFPAIVFGFPMMFLATLAPVEPEITMIAFVVFFLLMNVLLFRSKIFRSRKTKKKK